jgi:hypothetical protein
MHHLTKQPNALIFLLPAVLLSACATLPQMPPEYADAPAGTAFAYTFTPSDSAYLRRFARQCDLEALVFGAQTDLERVYRVSSWVNGLWRHHSSNRPSANDPLTILREVEEGERFRCVEYARVIHGALSALDMRCRLISMYKREPERTSSSHVACEVFLDEQSKWVFVDGQWNAIPVLGGVALNAVELQRELVKRNREVTFYERGFMPVYRRWVADYLFYLSFNPDSRVGISSFSHKNILLGPLNLPIPEYITKWHAENGHRLVDSTIVIRDVATFYASPE